MRYSAQAIVVDTQGRLYLEDNPVTGMLSFIGGKCEQDESYEDTVIREVEEELKILFPITRFLDGQEQPIRSFWNTREEKHIEWKSKYFVLILLDTEIQKIKQSIKLIILDSIDDLEKFPDEKFFPLGRQAYIQQVHRALSHI